MTLGAMISGSAGLAVVLTRFVADPAVAGLAVMYSLTVTGSLNWMVRQSADRESNIVAIERMLQSKKRF